MNALFPIRVCIAMIISSTVMSGYLLFMVGFASAWKLGDEISPWTIFPSFAVMSVAPTPLMWMAVSFGKFGESQVALQRISACIMGRERKEYVEKVYLHQQTKSPNNNNEPIETNDDIVAEITNVTVISEPDKNDEIVAPSLSTKIHKGKLTIVIGKVASGKSVLCRSLLGEASIDFDKLKQNNGFVKHFAAPAVVAQESFIFNDTLRNNIVLDQEFDAERFHNTLKVCQLLPDLKSFQSGIDTELGESSAQNVSGGQQQRINDIFQERIFILFFRCW
jgi:ATP-binding cassette, subfamily C (CFTR/MRP), member 1